MWGFVVLEAFDGCDNLVQHDFWVGGVCWQWGGGGGLAGPAPQEQSLLHYG